MSNQTNTYKYLFFGLLLVLASSGITFVLTRNQQPEQSQSTTANTPQVQSAISSEPTIVATDEKPFINLQRRLNDKKVTAVTCQTQSQITCELVAVTGGLEKSVSKKLTTAQNDDTSTYTAQWQAGELPLADAYYVKTYRNGAYLGMSVQN